MLYSFVCPVTIASVCGVADRELMISLVKQAAENRPDIVVLPENWQQMRGEALDSPVNKELQALAKEHKVYIISSTYIREVDGLMYNTALLIDREGKIAGRYDKRYPYWNEITDDPDTNALPGTTPLVFDTDFGRLGIAICFDANFPQLWAEMAEQGAELVIWPSAYAAGTQLAAHALNHHYPIVTSTTSGHFSAFDIDGRRIAHTNGTQAHLEWITLDLDRCIFHENFNQEILHNLISSFDSPVELEYHHAEEQWLVVCARKEGVSAREACKKAGMEELRAYKQRSRLAIDKLRDQVPRKGL